MTTSRWLFVTPSGLTLPLLAYRRDLPLLLAPSTALVMVAGAVIAGFCALAIPAIIERGAEKNRRRRLWAIPLVIMAVQTVALVTIAGIPTLVGSPHLWARILDIPPHWVARLVLNIFLLLTSSTLSGFTLAIIRTIRHPPRSEAPQHYDAITSLGLFTILAVVGSLILHWHISLPDNLLMVRALVALRTRESPRIALGLLHRLMAEHPESSLMDTAVFRAARILEEDLGHDEAATELYRAVIDDHPVSPWCDDAAFGLVRIAARRSRDSTAISRQAEELIERWPSSPRASDALLVAIRSARARNKRDEAFRLMKILKRDYPRSRTMEERAETYPWWNRSTLELASEALSGFE